MGTDDPHREKSTIPIGCFYPAEDEKSKTNSTRCMWAPCPENVLLKTDSKEPKPATSGQSLTLAIKSPPKLPLPRGEPLRRSPRRHLKVGPVQQSIVPRLRSETIFGVRHYFSSTVTLPSFFTVIIFSGGPTSISSPPMERRRPSSVSLKV